MIDLQPTECNLCGGDVIFTSNAKVYGKEYGSGKCYLCSNCGAYVGTHGPRPTEALGLLADKEMRMAKMRCHDLFDKLWRDKRERTSLYYRLSKEMGIPAKECHFGHMDLQQLEWAYSIVKRWESGNDSKKNL